MDNTSLIARMSLKYGLFAAIAYFLFFLLMRLFGLAEYTGLRYVNLLILAIFLVMGIKALRAKAPATNGYLAGFFTTIGITFFSAAFFAALMFAYIGIFDRRFLDAIADKVPFELHLNAFMFALLVAGEIIPFGIAICIAVMSYFQKYNRSVDTAMEEAKHADHVTRH